MYYKDLSTIVFEFYDYISIKKINNFFQISASLTLNLKLSLWKMLRKKDLNLNYKKPFTSGSMPTTVLKQSLDIYLRYLTKSVNYATNEGKFPAEFKHSEVTPLFKKYNPLKKENNRPESLLPHLSKSLKESYINK